jgi:2-polyprenyl-6-methoxyphenol hydroxylase-like FAD-dependent oxidoreductase
MKVAINGIGVAGPTLAYWLRKFGHDPVLFEESAVVRTGGYLIDFWGLGYEIAQRMNLIATLRERCYEMERLRMIARDGRKQADVDLAPMRDALQGRFISVARADLAAALLGSCSGIPAHFGLSITAIEQDAAGCTATLSDGRQERYDLVVGADGLHSQLRALVFGPEADFEQFLDCHVAAFRVRGYPHRDELTYVSHTVARRHASRVSLRDDETLVLFVCRAELANGNVPRDRESRKAILREAFDGMGWEVPELLDSMDAADDIYFDRVSQIWLPRWATGRVALLGDAAASPSLLAGEGAGLAMLEAYVLAGELHRANGDFALAFATFEGRLRAFVAAKQKSALWFRGFFAPDTAMGLAVRNVVVHALALPFIGRPLLARSFHDDFELPEYDTCFTFQRSTDRTLLH